MAKALRERVGKQYKGTQRTRKAVHGECTVELAKWTFPIISLCREPYEAKVSRTGLTGGMGRRTVRQRALCLPSGNSVASTSGTIPPFHHRCEGALPWYRTCFSTSWCCWDSCGSASCCIMSGQTRVPEGRRGPPSLCRPRLCAPAT